MFKKNIDSNEVAKDVLKKVDDSTLTMQERADKSVEYQERLGITASSKTRRFVTWFFLIFISSWFISMAVIYKAVSAEMSSQMFEWIKEYCSNAVIITIVSFFYGGYYLQKIISPQAKQRLDKKKQELAIKEKEAEIKIKEQEVNLSKKQQRIDRRRKKRDRNL